MVLKSVTGEFPAQRPVARSFDVSFDLCPNKRLSKQSWDWWIETQSCPLWRYCNNYSDELLRSINSFASRGCDCYFNSVISSFFYFYLCLVNTSCEIPLSWMPKNTFDDKSTLIQVKSWYRRQQSITWANVDPDMCHRIASLDCNDLTW